MRPLLQHRQLVSLVLLLAAALWFSHGVAHAGEAMAAGHEVHCQLCLVATSSELPPPPDVAALLQPEVIVATPLPSSDREPREVTCNAPAEPRGPPLPSFFIF